MSFKDKSNSPDRWSTRLLPHSHGFSYQFLPPGIQHDFCPNKIPPCCITNMTPSFQKAFLISILCRLSDTGGLYQNCLTLEVCIKTVWHWRFVSKLTLGVCIKTVWHWRSVSKLSDNGGLYQNCLTLEVCNKPAKTRKQAETLNLMSPWQQGMKGPQRLGQLQYYIMMKSKWWCYEGPFHSHSHTWQGTNLTHVMVSGTCSIGQEIRATSSKMHLWSGWSYAVWPQPSHVVNSSFSLCRSWYKGWNIPYITLNLMEYKSV